MFRLVWIIPFFLMSSMVLAQRQTQFGAPIRAEENGNSLRFETTLPPQELAKGAEVICIYGNHVKDEDTSGTRVNVEINRPASKVLLILGSNRMVHWNITATPSTKISAILVTAGREERALEILCHSGSM